MASHTIFQGSAQCVHTIEQLSLFLETSDIKYCSNKDAKQQGILECHF